jgi:ParB-like chromosome segregation protein Spo0J
LDPEYLPPPVVIVDIDSLTEWEDNPRFNEPAVPEVVASIKKYGFLQPLVVDQFNKVWAGNTRLKALRILGYKKIPVVRVEHLDVDALREFAIADNKTHELATWDEKKLLGMVKLADLAEIPGFTEKDISHLNSVLLKASAIEEIRNQVEKGVSKVSHTCPKCKHTWTA